MTTPVGLTLRMERTLNAPIERVFEVLTAAEHIGRWFGPSDDFRVTVHAWEAKEGGAYRVEFNTPDGETHIVVGTFTAIVPNSRVSYTWSWEGRPPMDTLVTFALEGKGRQTQLVFTHEGFPAEDVRGHHEQGWTGSMARLERVLAS